MPRARAAFSAVWRSREAIALNSTQSPFCMAGNTFFMPIPAVLSTPQRTFFGISGNHTRKLFSSVLPGFSAGPHGVAFFQKSAEPLVEVGAVADLLIPSHGTRQVAIEPLFGKRAQQLLDRAHGLWAVPEQERRQF